MLTAGNVSDVKVAPALLERAGRMRYLLADKGYDADRLRRSLRDAGTIPVIPGLRNRKRAIRYDKVSCPLLSGPSTMTVWTKEGTTNAFEEAQARGDHRQAA